MDDSAELSPAPRRARHPLTHRGYLGFFVARICTTLAQNGMIIVIGWQVYDLARATMTPREAALQLGLVGLVQFLPLFLLVPVTGWTADRIDRRFISRSCVALSLACCVVLGVLTFTHALSLPALFGVSAVLGVARAFYQPAQNALAPNLVPAEVLPQAIAASAIAGRVGAILGPALGGYLYALSPNAPYVGSGLLYALAIGFMLLIGPLKRSAMSSRGALRQMAEGFQYVIANRLVLGAISLDLFAVLLGGATAMLPIYARDILHVGPAGLGHLRAAPAVGALASAVWLAWRPLKTNVGTKMLISVALFGVATAIFGLSRWMPLSLVMLAVLGAADMVSVYIRQTLVQIYTPDEMRGRVGAVSSLFVSASNELGEAESGFLAAAIGPVAAVVAGGVGAVLVTGLWARLFPALRLARSFDQPTEDPEGGHRPPAPL
ncbi:MAG: MFS transporter [Caulobacterales bacterium 68-7]|nr:MFS transporter [Caulobacterales bacterium]OJU12797.1 MAG: MFS transporter [Caulobacterales bacterium 68-7]